MANSPDLGIPYVPSPPPAQAEVLHNEALNMLIALQKGAIDRGLNTPPGSPADGDVYILGAAPTGAWAGKANKIAIRTSTAWTFVPGNDSAGANIAIGARHEGLRIWVQDEDALYVWSGSAWTASVVSAANVSNVPAGNIAATTVQAALNELDGEKVAKAGDTMTGDLNGTGFNVLNASKANGAPASPLCEFVADAEFFYTQRANAAPTGYFARTLGTLGSPATVSSGTVLANFVFSGYDGASMQDSALFGAIVDGVVSSGVVPTAIRFLTGSSTGTRGEAARFDSAQNFQMGGANTVIDSDRLHRLRQYTVATLPTVGTAGRLAAVTDASTPAYNATVAGGGAVNIPVYDNGSNWTCH